MFLTVFHCFSHFYAQEQIAPVALLLTKKRAIRSKTKEQVPNPGILFKISLVSCSRNYSSLHNSLSEDKVQEQLG